MGASKCMAAYRHPLNLTKHAFFVLCMYRGHPNIIQTYMGHPNMWEAFKHGGCPNIQGGIQTYWGIQHTGGCANIWECPNIQVGHPNIWGTSKCMGVYGNPLSLTKHAFFLLYMYREHQNMGAYKHGGSKHMGVYIQGTSKHVGVSKHMGEFKHTGGHPNIQRGT